MERLRTVKNHPLLNHRKDENARATALTNNLTARMARPNLRKRFFDSVRKTEIETTIQT